MNEERLDYEIHVLRKHEEEIVLVKSEQKRKITILQDTINKLRRKVRKTNAHISREEASLHENINNIRYCCACMMEATAVTIWIFQGSIGKAAQQKASLQRIYVQEKR